MLTEIYTEALLFDEGLADRVWEVWNAGAITDDLVVLAWWLIAYHVHCPSMSALGMIEF